MKKSEERARLALLVSTLLLSWIYPSAYVHAEGEVVLEGKVALRGEGTGNIEVVALPFSSGPAAPVPATPRTRTNPEGSFRLAVPPGTYLLTAGFESHFAFFGRNPVRADRDITGIKMRLAPVPPVEKSNTEPGTEHIKGRVLRDGTVEGAHVFVYADASGGLRGPSLASSPPTGADGGYQLDLAPGHYFLAARKRVGGWRPGALSPGDLYAVRPELPLALAEGETVRVDFEVVAIPEEKTPEERQAKFARIEGEIVRKDGTPLAGMRACLYIGPNVMGRPAMVSEPTGPDGRFVLVVPAAGTYYLRARERIGGPPLIDERLGFPEGDARGALDLKPGANLVDVKIVVQ